MLSMKHSRMSYTPPLRDTQTIITAVMLLKPPLVYAIEKEMLKSGFCCLLNKYMYRMDPTVENTYLTCDGHHTTRGIFSIAQEIQHNWTFYLFGQNWLSLLLFSYKNISFNLMKFSVFLSSTNYFISPRNVGMGCPPCEKSLPCYIRYEIHVK